MLFSNKPWIRFIYIIPSKGLFGDRKIEGPWFPFNQEKVDDLYDLMDGIAGNEINYLHVNDKKGNIFLISPEIAQKLVVKIEQKNRLY